MGISVSILLIAVGAILTWAVSATVSGVDLVAVGVILMIVGILGLVISLIFWSSWGGFGAAPERNDGTGQTTIVNDPGNRASELKAVDSSPGRPALDAERQYHPTRRQGESV